MILIIMFRVKRRYEKEEICKPQSTASHQKRCLPTQFPPTEETGGTEKEGCKTHSRMCHSQMGPRPPSMI